MDTNTFFWIDPNPEPRLITETRSYSAVYKPPRMHTAPLKHLDPGKNGLEETGQTLLDWIVLRFPEVLFINGYKENEGGLLHRLDYETQGLVLFARTQKAFDKLAAQQKTDGIIKEYDAVSAGRAYGMTPAGFPPYSAEMVSAVVESAFRPYGKGRKQVRPLAAVPGGIHSRPRSYRTEIFSHTAAEGKQFFRLRISKGFRHQIRCHLAWIGCPILNDSLYGGKADAAGFLALRASGLSFTDPESGKIVRISAAK